jgi:hypothetical protein
MKGAIGEKAGMKMSKYIPGCTPEGETAEGKPSGFSDVKIKLNGIPSPEEVKTCDLTGKSIKERNDVFLNAFKRGKDSATEQIKNDFEKEVFKNSEAGIAIIIGFDENKINPNAEYVEIEVLIAKVYRDGSYDILYKPSWYSD